MLCVQYSVEVKQITTVFRVSSFFFSDGTSATASLTGNIEDK